ncbi:MAG TPA: ABC transporter permease [Kiritimatiellia bacterium]|mgnify:CR=1 FL=1|nr:ABC transporter permease [Kiritimatiellia bacterium]HMO97909.1 ABC transporter permease [Kiritimatiellia bacterium]HMP95572.1 ABC transporter permease [Kiritimatiellia bacterium]
MHVIFAIALLAIRNAVRSKIVLILLVALIAAITLIPLTVRGDGTLSGLFQIVLSYTLGFSAFILTLNALWAGNASVASEISDKTMQLVVTKPVSRWQVWMGKWLGLTVMNAALWAVCGAVTFGMLHAHLHLSRLTDPAHAQEAQRLLTARETRLAASPDFATLAQQRLEQEVSRAPLPEGVTPGQRLMEIEQRMRIDALTVNPGGSRRWEFPKVTAAELAEPFTLRYRFASSILGQGLVRGRWLIGTPGRTDLLDVTRDSVPRALNEIVFRLDQRWENQPLVITYVDMDSEGASILFDVDGGIALLVPRGGFTANFIRGWLIMFGRLAFFTALGVTAGCLFSLPVATVVSLFLMTMVQMGGYIQDVAQTPILLPGHAASPEEAMSLAAILVTLIFKGMAFLVSPLVQESILTHLAGGKLVDNLAVVRGLLIQGLIFSLLMSGMAAYAMNRRQLALPAS